MVSPMVDIVSASHEALRIANLIQGVVGESTSGLPTPTEDARIMNVPTLISPEPLTPQLLDLGLPRTIAEGISEAFLRNAESLKTTTERIIHTTCSNLAGLPRADGLAPIEVLHQEVFDAHYRRFSTTLAHWVDQAKELALSQLSDSKNKSTPTTRLTQQVKRKRRFRSEYLPLFEFAFEKDRFPSREDKRHLAKITGMSYRQICVWFQNRRCRQVTRTKSNHLTQPPQTFEEMKERLSASARDALSKTSLSSKDALRNLENSPSDVSALAAQDAAVRPIGSLQVMTLPRPNERDSSIDASEVSVYSSDSQKRDALHSPAARNFVPFLKFNQEMLSPSPCARMTLPETSENSKVEDEFDGLDDEDIAVSMSLPISPEHASTLAKSPKPSAPTVFPAPYKPSRSTFNPFVVAREPWPRSCGTSTCRIIDPTPEVLEGIMDGLHDMEIDVKILDSEDSTAACTGSAHFGVALSPKSTVSPRIPLGSHPSVRRTFSSSSSGSSASWSFNDTGFSSRSSSYSTAPSSVLSSPHLSEKSLLAPGECAIEVFSDYASSPLAIPAEDQGSVCDAPAIDQISTGSRPSIKPTSDTHVAAWTADVATQEEQEANGNKWEQLLAAVAVQSSPDS